MKMYRNDLKPDLELTLTDAGQPVDLTPATSIRIIGMKGATVLFDRTVTGNAQGVVTMPWQAADTDEVGRIMVEVEVMWPGSKPQTFRPTGSVDILADYA